MRNTRHRVRGEGWWNRWISTWARIKRNSLNSVKILILLCKCGFFTLANVYKKTKKKKTAENNNNISRSIISNYNKNIFYRTTRTFYRIIFNIRQLYDYICTQIWRLKLKKIRTFRQKREKNQKKKRNKIMFSFPRCGEAVVHSSRCVFNKDRFG